MHSHEQKLYKPNGMSSFYATFYWIRIVNIWNTLPDKVMSAPSVAIQGDPKK